MMGTIEDQVEEKSQSLLFDDYFTSPNSPGVAATVVHRGVEIKLKIKKSLTLDELQQAADAGLALSIDKAGQAQVTKMDQGAYSRKVVLLGVKQWPFTYDDGSPVPINKNTVAMMDGNLANKIADVILGNREAQQKALDPFVEKSEEDS